MADVSLSAKIRTEFGKGASRRLRRSGGTPAVLYGHGSDPIHLELPAQETYLALRASNVLMEIAVEGESEKYLALPKQVQRDPILPRIKHVDLLLVTAGEKVSVDVHVVLTGEAERGSMVNQDLTSITVLAPATDIPEEVEVSLDGLAIGDQIHVRDVKLPQGVEADVDGDLLVASITTPPVVQLEEETDTGADAAESEAAAEGDDDSE